MRTACPTCDAPWHEVEDVSPVVEFVSGRFQEVLDDPGDAEWVRRVVVCSG